MSSHLLAALFGFVTRTASQWTALQLIGLNDRIWGHQTTSTWQFFEVCVSEKLIRPAVSVAVVIQDRAWLHGFIKLLTTEDVLSIHRYHADAQKLSGSKSIGRYWRWRWEQNARCSGVLEAVMTWVEREIDVSFSYDCAWRSTVYIINVSCLKTYYDINCICIYAYKHIRNWVRKLRDFLVIMRFPGSGYCRSRAARQPFNDRGSDRRNVMVEFQQSIYLDIYHV